MVRKLFNYNKWESVKSVLFKLGRLNVAHLIMIRKINFYRHLFTSKSCTLYNVLCLFCHVATMICASQFLPARRYASAGYSDRNVSVCLSVCPSRAGIVSKRRKLSA